MELFSSRKRAAEVQGARRGRGLYHQEIIFAALKGLGEGRAGSDLGRGLVEMVEQAHIFRQIQAVEQISSTLVSLGLPREFRVIGEYFQALCVREESEDGLARSTALLENVISEAPAHYRARALVSLGTNATTAHDYDSGLKLYVDAARVAVGEWRDSETAVQAQRNLAVVRSIGGDHHGALASLEALHPLACRVGSWHPHVYYDYLNSLAVELGEVGRLEEASNVSERVVASPFAQANPEWSETRDEIARRGRGASRSFVPVAVASPEPADILSAVGREKVRSRSEFADSRVSKELQHAHNSPTARLLVFPERKPRPPESDGAFAPPQQDTHRSDCLSASEKRAAVAKLLFHEDSPAVMDRMLEAVGLVSNYPGDSHSKNLNLESPCELEELIRRWLNGAIEPEELAAVLSALRDCDDELRRTNILDQMISIAFVETMQHYESERDWRKRVEARLISFGADLA